MPVCGLVTVGECGSRLNAVRMGADSDEKEESGIDRLINSHENLHTKRQRIGFALQSE